MNYRPEIDGLRAVAVIPVIFFHGGFEILSGGFVGVDVFFVISGYLITCILIAESERGNFSLVRFYERRARRILPALFFVMACTLPFAWFWMLPTQFGDFSKSLVAVVIFASNFLFWQADGYFAAASELKPLLHTWSLAVEEQYYLLFPLVMMALWRFGRRQVFGVIVVVSVLSLLLSEWGWRHHPSANFYLAPTRAWELFAGSICAFLISGRKPLTNNWLSGAGLALILFAIFFFDATTPFPSLYALAPVGGTVLIVIFGHGGTWVARLLSARACVGIGLISYSAYLWHQPVFAFARIRHVTSPPDWLMLLLAGLSLVLAYLSWRFVEQPFRGKPARVLPSRQAIFGASAIIGCAFAGFGFYGSLSSGLAWRLPPHILALAAAEQDQSGADCYLLPGEALPVHPVSGCLAENSQGNVDVILFGDSHAFAISQELKKELKARDIGYYETAYPGCLPLPDFIRTDLGDLFECTKYVDGILDYARNAGISTIVPTGRYTVNWTGYLYDNGEGGVESGDPVATDLVGYGQLRAAPGDPDRRDRVLAGYSQKLETLANEFNVVLVYPIPEAGWNVPNTAAANAMFRGSEAELSTSLDRFLERNGPVLDLFDALQSDRIFKVRPHEILCRTEDRRCANTLNGDILYFDDDHMSNAGARLLSPAIVRAVRAALQD